MFTKHYLIVCLKSVFESYYCFTLAGNWTCILGSSKHLRTQNKRNNNEIKPMLGIYKIYNACNVLYILKIILFASWYFFLLVLSLHIFFYFCMKRSTLTYFNIDKSSVFYLCKKYHISFLSFLLYFLFMLKTQLKLIIEYGVNPGY